MAAPDAPGFMCVSPMAVIRQERDIQMLFAGFQEALACCSGSHPRPPLAMRAIAVKLSQGPHHSATAERERERLAYFASPEGRDELYE